MPKVSSHRATCESPSITPLDDLVAEVVTRLEAGKSIEVAKLTAECPALREPLEKLLPTLTAMVDLGHAAAAAGIPQKKHGATPSSPPPAAAHLPSGFSPLPRRDGPGPLGLDVAREGGSSAGILGDFRILHELGRGGMGVVYEAEQISLGRRVALKVLPFAAMLDKQQLVRFKNEARAAATLKHPNIVSVYSVGSERGVHFYAMELIEGNSLAEVIAAMRQQSGRAVERKSSIGVVERQSSEEPTIDHQSSSNIPATDHGLRTTDTLAADHLSTLLTANHHEFFQSAARLGIQAAEALQHAHDLGVLHRDIKPSNLMLDAASQLFITDFGLARIEADAGVTMTGDLIGTLRYMAPEQALAKRVVIDHRADVYSLGATLYELVTLQPAFGESDRSALLKQIAFEDPPSLRKLDRRIPVELETIILKAMEKNPEERYQTAERLAADLRAYLELRPIEAKPPTIIGRTAKWSRRHKPLVWSVGASAAGLVLILLAVLTLSNLIISRERNQKAAALLELSTASKQAEANFARTLFVVECLFDRASNGEFPEEPRNLRSWTYQPNENRVNSDLERGVSLDIEKTEDLLSTLANCPIVEKRLLARICSVIGARHASAGRQEDAEVAYRESLRNYRASIVEKPTSVLARQQFLNDAGSFVRLMRDQPQWKNAGEVYEDIITNGVWLLSNVPNLSAEQRYDILRAMTTLGPTLNMSGIRQKVIATVDTIPTRNEMDFDVCAELYNAFGEHELNLRAQRDKLTILIEKDPTNPSHWHSRGWINNCMKDYERAVDDYSESLRLNFRRTTLEYRGDAYKRLGRYEEAKTDYTKALALETKFGARGQAFTWERLGDLYNLTGDFDKAIENYSEAIVAVQLVGFGGASNYYRGRAKAYREVGRLDLALADLSATIDDSPRHAEIWAERAQVNVELKNFAKAIRDFNEAIRLDPGNQEFISNRDKAIIEMGE